jgi:hypothetical protein
MDRVFQLDGLLQSYFGLVQNPAPLLVLYRSTTDQHQAAYDQLIQLWKSFPVTFVRQNSRDSFKSQLLGALDGLTAPTLFFLVDDNVFKNPVDLEEWLQMDPRDFVPSLRMAPGMNYCYTARSVQEVPPLRPLANSKQFLEWSWRDGSFDWAYPLSVDGHLLDRAEITAILAGLEFNSPNTLEGALQQCLPHFLNRPGVCAPRSAVVNLALNKVQSDNANRHGEIHQDELLRMWEDGLRLDWRALTGISNQSAHIELGQVPTQSTSMERRPF